MSPWWLRRHSYLERTPQVIFFLKNCILNREKSATSTQRTTMDSFATVYLFDGSISNPNIVFLALTNVISIRLQSDGLCDKRKRPCKQVTVLGTGFLNSKNMTCHVKEFKVRALRWIFGFLERMEHKRLLNIHSPVITFITVCPPFESFWVYPQNETHLLKLKWKIYNSKLE